MCIVIVFSQVGRQHIQDQHKCDELARLATETADLRSQTTELKGKNHPDSQTHEAIF